MDIESLRRRKFGSYTHSYTSRDTVLYALGLGCSTAEEDLRYIYEGGLGLDRVWTYGAGAGGGGDSGPGGGQPGRGGVGEGWGRL